MPNSWQDQLGGVRLIVRMIYGSAAVFALLIVLKIPRVDYRWGPLQQSFLFSMLMMAVSTFPLSRWVSRRFWRGELALEETSGYSRVPGGAFIMAILGEACAVYGYALYCISGDTRWPWLFLFLCAGHYVYTMSRLETVARSLPV